MIIQGIANWACIQSPNTKFEPVYSIDLVIEASVAKELKGLGLKPKRNDDGDWTIKLKRKAFNKEGVENPKPKVVDAKNQPFNELVGNGSRVNVLFSVYNWENSFGKGTSADLAGVQVLDLVPYLREDFEAVDEGAKAPKPPKVGSDEDFDDDLPDL